MRDGASPVVHYYSFSADSGGTQSMIAVPDGCVDIIFTAGGGGSGRIYGPVTRHGRIDGIGLGAECFGVRFRPGAMPARINIGLPELVENSAPLGSFDGGAEIIERICAADGFLERIRLLADFFGGAWRTPELLRLLIAEVMKRKGDVRISSLAESSGYSERYINKVFCANLGMSPKAFARSIRFQSVLGELNALGPVRLTDLAVNHGYCDQSHFIKEFKEASSLPPREYARAIDLKTYHEKIIYL
jgi:AraC-like DNA-binding protein